jgi:hypothetical protein
MTDGFGEEVERVAAARVADRCSNPSCRALTSGADNDRRKSLNIGLAVHITALSPGDRRYDPALSDQEREDPGNAIWLCHTCVRLVDNDVARHPAALLRSWKTKAEATTLTMVDSGVTS